MHCKYLLASHWEFPIALILFILHSPARDHLKRRAPNNGGLSLRKIHRRKARKAVTLPTGLRRIARFGQLSKGRSESLVRKG